MAHESQAGGEAAHKSPSPIGHLTPEEHAAAPAECAGCGRDAIVWVRRESGGLLGYCGYLDSGACLAVVMDRAAT